MPSTPFLPIRHPVIEAGPMALMTEPWMAWARSLQGIVAGLNVIPGVNIKTMAELNALGLGLSDSGYIAWETGYGHALRWTGAVWQFAPGDPGSGWWALRPVAPQEIGWQVMDGTATDYLTVGGATLTATPYTTPNVTAGTFLKTLAAYTGTIEAAIAAGLSGSTGNTAPTISGTTAAESAHTHSFSATTGDNSAFLETDAVGGTNFALADDPHHHSVSGTTGSGSAHDHGAGSLAVSSHLHGSGTLAVDTAARPPSLGGLLYFRR